MIATNKEVLYDDGSRYVTVFDPLDGSSNIDAGIPTGTCEQDHLFHCAIIFFLF